MDMGHNRTIEVPSGHSELCSCYEDLCNNSPWLEWTKPTKRKTTTRRHSTRRPTTGRPTPRKQTDSEEVSLPSDPEGVLMPTDSEKLSLPSDSEGVSPTEKSMLTQSMNHTLPDNYNDNSTDKIQSNGVKALNVNMVFATLLTLLIYIF